MKVNPVCLSIAVAAAFTLPLSYTLADSSNTFEILVTFDYPGAMDTHASAINEQGDVAGGFSNDSGGYGFVRFRHGRFSKPILDPKDTDRSTSITGMNNVGTFAGTYVLKDHIHGFLATDGIFTEITTGAYHTVLGGVNDAGNFCGQTYFPYKGFVNIDGPMTFFAIPGSDFTFARAINNLNQCVGYYAINYTYVGFVRDASGNITAPIRARQSQYTFLYGMNDKGAMVGEVWDATGVHGVVFQSTDHAELYDYPGATTTSLSGINNRGLICGTYSDGNNYHGFILRVRSAIAE